MNQITLHQGDNRDHLRAMAARGEFVHAVVCDPPYGLVSVTKRFGKQGAAPAKFGSDGAFQRAGGGFMGKQWDASGIERDPEFWRLVYDVMLPGAYIIAFSSSRTYGYMQVALEEAGFITMPMIGWTYSQGFPKDHDAPKAIDKVLGTPGSVVPSGAPVKRMIPGADQHRDGSWIKDNGREYQPGQYVPGSPEAAQWDGWGYGAQALKPALEPIYVGQKPFSEKNGALNILKHGVGAINIDGCRVPADGSTGRHPANLIHDGSPEVVALFPESAGQQAPVKGTEPSRTGDENTVCYGEYGRVPAPTRSDTSGSAARFFNSFPHEGPLFHYPKASKADRAGSKHATVKPVALMRHLVRMHCPKGGTVLDPFGGSGTTGQACLSEGMACILMEMEQEYADDIRRRFGLRGIQANDDDFDSLLGGDEFEGLL